MEEKETDRQRQRPELKLRQTVPSVGKLATDADNTEQHSRIDQKTTPTKTVAADTNKSNAELNTSAFFLLLFYI